MPNPKSDCTLFHFIMIRPLELPHVSLVECGTCNRQNTSISVSWNCTGDQLASSSYNGAKIWPTDASSCSVFMEQSLTTNSVEASAGSGTGSGTVTSMSSSILRELATLPHDALVERVRFHPMDPFLLCTNVANNTVQFWDLRDLSKRTSVGSIKLQSLRGRGAASVEWQSSSCGGPVNHLVITEKDSSVRVHDVRKLSQAASSSMGGSGGGHADGSSTSSQVKSFSFQDCYLAETHFSPSGEYLVSAAKRIQDGMGIVKVYPWQTGDDMSVGSASFVCHAGPIYSLKFSPNGKYLATGGDDALVGLWDVRSMVCKSTLVKKTKFIRSVAFSHDSNVVAYCSEERGVDLADASTGADVGDRKSVV